MNDKSQQLRDDIENGNFHGSQKFYKTNMVVPVVHTEGIQFIIENVSAHWLMSDIAVNTYYLNEQLKNKGENMFDPSDESLIKVSDNLDDRLVNMQFWQLIVNEDQSAVLECRADCDEPIQLSQTYTYTDFPVGTWDVWAAKNEYWTLLMPSEY